MHISFEVPAGRNIGSIKMIVVLCVTFDLWVGAFMTHKGDIAVTGAFSYARQKKISRFKFICGAHIIETTGCTRGYQYHAPLGLKPIAIKYLCA